jgi:hypothetical protein
VFNPDFEDDLKAGVARSVKVPLSYEIRHAREAVAETALRSLLENGISLFDISQGLANIADQESLIELTSIFEKAAQYLEQNKLTEPRHSSQSSRRD